MYSDSGIDEHRTRLGWCQAKAFYGEPCGKYFSSTPPYLQLFCVTHRTDVDHDAPCYFLKLPTELRQEIFKYLMPTRTIDSWTIYRSIKFNSYSSTGTLGSSVRTVFPTPLLSLYLGFNREVYEEVKDVFYTKATFSIDVSRNGVMLCGRRILGPRAPDGSSYYYATQQANDRFIQNFAWSSVRNYNVNIAIERGYVAPGGYRMSGWDEEVELYDIRDFVVVIVYGVLAKAHRLDTLQVRLSLNKSDWDPEYIISNTKLLLGPLEQLRCVRKPRFEGVYRGDSLSLQYGQCHRAWNDVNNPSVTPLLPEPLTVLGPGMPEFDSLAVDWERCLATKEPSNILPRSPMTILFVEFKTLHKKLAKIMPHVVRHHRQCFLHRARVAREHEDIASFRAVVAELLACWRHRLQLQELERAEVNMVLQRLISADTYPHKDQDVTTVDEAQSHGVIIDLT